MQTHPTPAMRTPATVATAVATRWVKVAALPWPNLSDPAPTNTRRALTLKQQALLDYIAKCIVVEHHWPTVKQAARDFVVTTNAIATALKMIEKKGHITRNAWGKPMLSGYTLCAWAPGCNTPVTP